MFNWIVGIPLLTLFGSTALTISLLPSNRQESGRGTLKVLLVLVSLWTFSSLMLHITAIPSTVFWLCSIIAIGGLLFSVGVHFCANFTRSSGTFVKLLVILAYLVAFLIIIGVVTGNMVSDVLLLPNGAVDIEFGRITPVMWGTIPIIILISLAILISSIVKSPDTRGRYTILPIAGFVILLFGALSNIFISQYPIDVLTGFIFISLVSYSVVSSHILRPVTYEKWWLAGPGVFLILAICYTGIFTFSSEWMKVGTSFSHVSAAFATIVLFLATFEPLRALITREVFRYIFPFSHRYYEALNSLTKVDWSLTQWDSSINAILGIIVETAEASETILLMKNDETQCFETAYSSNNLRSVFSLLSLPVDSPLIKSLKDLPSSVMLSDIEQQANDPDIASSFDNLRKSFENALFCGLYGHEGLAGIIISMKVSPGGWKRNEDRDFLELACQQITPLIDNYLLYQSVQRELTQRKLVQRALEQSEEKYRTLVEYANDYIFMFDRDLKVLSVNKAAGKFLGGEPETFVGKSVLELFYPEISEPYSHDLEKVLETGFTLVGDSHIKMGDQEVELNTVLSPIKDNEGQVLAIIGVSRDISERKRAEEKEKMLLNQLHIAKRLAIVGEMTAGVAHEVNNPLTAVIVASDWLMGLKLPDEIRKDVEIINKGAQRAADILERMITFTSQRSVQKDYLDIGQILEIAIEFRAHSLSNNSISIIREYSEDLPNTMGNGEQLQEVFLNLIINAEYEMKEAHGEGQLIIRTEVVGDNIKISFIDNGRGIREENIDSLFNPFFTTKEVGKGSGLGLSICYGIITEHGGKIYAESTFGEGATFVIELPIVKSQSNPAV